MTKLCAPWRWLCRDHPRQAVSRLRWAKAQPRGARWTTLVQSSNKAIKARRAIPGQKARVASRANRGQQVNPVLPGRRERGALLDRKASPDHREGQKRVRLPFELFVASLQSPANRRRFSSAPIAQALRMKLNLLPSLFRREPRDVPASLTLPWSSP